MKRKGFTLVELLAVIIVLATIAVIIVPNVIVVVQRSEKDSFEKSAYGIALKESFENNASFDLTINSEKSGTTVYGYVKDNTGNINTCSKTVKRDASKPEISPKSELINYTSSDGNKDIISLGFNLTYGKSGGSYVCTYNGKNVTKVSELGTHHRVSVTCEATSGSGLKAKATTTFRYYYSAKINYYCDSGWSLNESTCSKGNSEQIVTSVELDTIMQQDVTHVDGQQEHINVTVHHINMYFVQHVTVIVLHKVVKHVLLMTQEQVVHIVEVINMYLVLIVRHVVGRIIKMLIIIILVQMKEL